MIKRVSGDVEEILIFSISLNTQSSYISKHHHLAILIVRNAHKKVFHYGVKDTFTEIRAKY